MRPIRWLEEPEEHDYPAAQDYLELLMAPAMARKLVAQLRQTETDHKKAKDLLRASGLDLLSVHDPHVDRDLEKIVRGHPLSPLLLVRGSLNGPPLEVADGYHRLCAAFHEDVDAVAPCRIADLGHAFNPTGGLELKLPSPPL